MVVFSSFSASCGVKAPVELGEPPHENGLTKLVPENLRELRPRTVPQPHACHTPQPRLEAHEDTRRIPTDAIGELLDNSILGADC